MAALVDPQLDLTEDLAAIETAASNAGIVPGDPGYPFVCGMTRVLGKFGQRLDATLKTLEGVPQEVPIKQLATETAYAVAQVLDKFGERVDAALKPLEDSPQRVPIERLAEAAAYAVDHNVVSLVRSRDRRTLVRISAAWALALLVGMAATYWAGYSAASSRRVLALCAAGQIHLDPESKRHYCTLSEWVD